jgi:hypothetical protein
MNENYETTRVLITVMTYPHPSQHHRELVCTAGVTATGEWVRLYPIDYRYRPNHQQFRKYQWIDVDLAPRGSGNDQRAESRKPRLDSIRIVGEPLPSDDGWRERRAIIDRLPVRTVNELRLAYDERKTSLGIVRPKRVVDLKIEEADRDWKPEWQALFNQFNLFGEHQKPLAKLPFKFSYVFECDDSDKPHCAMIEDWELGVLFLKERDRLGDEQAAAESVRHKFFDQLCASDRDTRFFMGTVFPYNTWVVIGVFWPPREQQLRLGF